MNLFSLSWNYIKSKPLNTLLNVLLLSLGIAIILVLILLSSQLEEKLAKDKRGVDLVVGAKGSPLQLILANVYHIDFPTGNINLAEAKSLTRNRLIESTIPLALGDNYQGFRIVGTNHDYINLYEGKIAAGELFKYNLDVTLGSNVAKRLDLKLGDHFHGAHGMSVTDLEHDEKDYIVAGILEPSGSVLDNLILTNIESVWAVHEHEEEHAQEDGEEHAHEKVLGSAYETGLPAGDEDAEVTSLLVKFRSPMGAVTLPRMINSQTNMQAASPAFETQRLFSLLGIGVNMLRSFAYIIIFISGLSIFISLYNALKDRKYDLAIMRSLGASRSKLFVHVVLEGIIITTLGGLLGLLFGHGLMELLAGYYEKSDEVGVTGLIFVQEELYVLLISVGVGIVASLLPAFNAYKTDISKVLADD
ncbi:ABC transporter permease [Roseivirga pacifica]|uniref:ABC transporter permease n=1 Tax=Roseivirga pacifica TaxID=1267423 RepID=UPI003BAFFBB6